MSNDTKEIATPSGKKVVIRNYTTHGDDKQAEALLNEGTSISEDDDGKRLYNISLGATGASEAKYVELLVQSIDGNSDNLPAQLDELRSEDYKAVADAVRAIASTDPKASRKS